MKKLLFIVMLILISSVVFSQSEHVIQLDGMKKDAIYNRSLTWLATAFVSSKAIIDIKDENQGIIIGNISVKLGNFLYSYMVQTKLQIDIKDGKARLTFTPMQCIGQDGEKWPPRSNNIEAANEEYAKLLISFTEAMKKKDDNW